ncbi:MAG: hypothetical protein O9264_02350 [Leptospira sp.]|nr:hypothetical protein [Leptospira sp.]
MKTRHYIIVAILSLNQCDSKNPFREEIDLKNREQTVQMELQRKKILEMKQVGCKLSPHIISKEDAIQNFLIELQKTPTANLKTLTSNDEDLGCIFPHTVGFGTALDFTPILEYQNLMQQRREMGLRTIREKIQNHPFKIKALSWEKPRNYNGIYGHKPSSLVISSNGKNHYLSEIKMVFEVNGTFKVGVLGN